jgi:hypothetical protein
MLSCIIWPGGGAVFGASAAAGSDSRTKQAATCHPRHARPLFATHAPAINQRVRDALASRVSGTIKK